MTQLSIDRLNEIAAAALIRAGASPEMARYTDTALVTAQAQGLASHGLLRVPQYASHLRHGRVNGAAVPRALSTPRLLPV
jgi:(2R)-3-sulfolactate dehydrogenase (NADP+)